MTRSLDPYTLRQAAARWPTETLNTRAAQGFLHELADDAEWQRHNPGVAYIAPNGTAVPRERLQRQPATAPDPLRAGLQELVDTFPDTWISRAALQSLLDEHR